MVKSHIEKGGFTTYWDEKAGAGKEQLRREAAQSIDGCSIFLCCLSQEYIENALTLKEIRLAQFWGKAMVVVKVGALPLDASGKEHMPPKHEMAPLVSKLFPVDLTDPKTQTAKLRDLMSRLEKQLQANSSAGPPGNHSEGSSRPAVPVADMQPDDVCQVRWLSSQSKAHLVCAALSCAARCALRQLEAVGAARPSLLPSLTRACCGGAAALGRTFHPAGENRALHG